MSTVFILFFIINWNFLVDIDFAWSRPDKGNFLAIRVMQKVSVVFINNKVLHVWGLIESLSLYNNQRIYHKIRCVLPVYNGLVK